MNFFIMDTVSTNGNVNTVLNQLDSDNSQHQNLIEKLQAIRLWQLMQQEELKKQQQMQLALLKSQHNLISQQSGDIEDEILAVPISDNLDHINPVGHTSMDDNIEDQENENCHATEENAALVVEEDDCLQSACITTESQNIGSNKHASRKHESDDEVQLDGKTDHDDILHCDIESSFEKVSIKPVAFDDIPVKGGKTFEDMLAEQLVKEKVKESKKDTSSSTPKRTFLRKGQGIARFNGPPKRPKVKKKQAKNVLPSTVEGISVNIKTNQRELPKFQEISETNQEATVPKSDQPEVRFKTEESHDSCQEEVILQKPRIRKTARLTRHEPIKQLILKPQAKEKHESSYNSLFFDMDKNSNESINESQWSEAEESALMLDTTQGQNDLDQSSNETFEQMEKFCYEHYADVTSVKTLEEDDSVLMRKIEPPPPNKLMLSLFPSLRSHKKQEKLSQPNSSASNLSKSAVNKATQNRKHTGDANTQLISNNTVDKKTENDSVQSKILKSKLEEMECEIKRFQDETAKLSSVRKEEETHLQLLKQEFEEFQHQKEEELSRLDEFKRTEAKKLKKDRKLFEEHVAAIKALPNKQDRIYIQELEKQITEQQSDFKQKEQRLSAVNNRLRSQIDALTEENENLKIKMIQLEEKLSKLEREKEIRKNKKSQVVWKAINDIVDSVPNTDENTNIDDYIESHSISQPFQPMKFKPQAMSLLNRSPLADCNGHQLNDSEVKTHGRKIERRKKDGSLEISFQNGTQKIVSADGTTQIKFTNGDRKTVLPDGTVNYFYIESGTQHITHPNGMQEIEFSNKQIERHFPDGSKHISFVDGSSKMIKLDGTEETVYPDGTKMVVSPSGIKTIEFANGQREIHTDEFKRREYPDGTCKTVFSDGRQETKYSSGRLRIKDANGTLIVDKLIPT